MFSRTSCDVVLAAAKALSAAWLSKHISFHFRLENSSIFSERQNLFGVMPFDEHACSCMHSLFVYDEIDLQNKQSHHSGQHSHIIVTIRYRTLS